MKKTKIITSLGPASNTVDVFEKMVLNGANCARINFSHATEEEKMQAVETVKEVRKRTGINVGILYDTKGPEFRNGVLENNEITLKEGKTIRVVKEEVIGNEERFSVNHPNAIDSLEVGNIILLENGLMKIEVISKENDGVTCKIINGGVLGNKKSLSVPGVKLDIPFISEQDKEDIIYACNHDGNFIALSFVSCVEDVLEAKKIIREQNREDMQIISKIESMTGIENLEAIVEESDGIMVARGDLGVEVPMTMLPIYQKEIIKTCREKGKICIVATEMLESMKKSARPTRAEVSDVANAVLDGTDAVMLSGETTTGKFPVETVSFMANICKDAEKNYTNSFDYKKKIGITETIAASVIEATKDLNIKAVVASSISGYSAKKISNLKPNANILATCTSEEVACSLALNYGVQTCIVPICNSTDEVVELGKEKAKEVFNLNKEDKIIITGGFPNNSEKRVTNFMKIEEI